VSRSFAEGTTVTAGRTKGEIEDMLMRRGVEQFGTMASASEATVMFAYKGLTYRITIKLPDREDPRFTTYKQGSSTFRRADSAIDEKWSAELNRKWRALAAVIKAKLIAVEEEISSFEAEFLSHVVTDTGQTLGDRMIPDLKAAALDGRIPSALALPGRSKR
jgi:hypothetical protein